MWPQVRLNRTWPDCYCTLGFARLRGDKDAYYSTVLLVFMLPFALLQKFLLACMFFFWNSLTRSVWPLEVGHTAHSSSHTAATNAFPF